MATPRFVEPERLTADDAVEKVMDTLHGRLRVRRSLWNLPKSEWEEARERFRDLAQLSHPALPRLVAVGEEKRILTLVEDYVVGETLQARIDSGRRATVEEAVQLMVPVVQALGAMHGLFMGHGGVDTRAIVIDAEGRAYLVGAGAREALPDADFESIAEVLVRMVEEPSDELHALVQDLRLGKLRDCSKILERLRALAPDADFGSHLEAEEPLAAEVEDDSDSDDDFDWVGMGDDLESRRRADDLRVLRYFGIGTAIIAGVGLATSMDFDGGPTEPPTDEELLPEGPIELASIAPEAIDDLAEDEVRRVDGLGKWRVRREAGRRHPATTLSLEAENDVRDRLERPGRAMLHLHCAERELSVSVSPGVETVEAFVAEDATYAKHANLALTWEGFPAQPIEGDFRPETPELDLRNSGTWLTEAPRSQSLYLSYTPFASDPVVAIFDVRGMERALHMLARHCTLP